MAKDKIDKIKEMKCANPFCADRSLKFVLVACLWHTYENVKK